MRFTSSQKDGSVIAEFDLDDTEEIKRWILSFGRHAEAMEPEELRIDMADELTVLHNLYGREVSERSESGVNT